MPALPPWLLVIPILALLILVHELGHFITAKRFGIKVIEFGFGFPPRIFGFSHNDTIYSINLLPIGGFVKMLGEEDPEDPRSFARQPIPIRIIVLAAGSIMNMLVAILVFTSISALPHDVVIGDISIAGVAPYSPAEQANLKVGDIIESVNGVRVNKTSTLIREIQSKTDEKTKLTVRKRSIIGNISSSPEFSTVETLVITPRKNPPALKVVSEVKYPEQEISLEQARSYNGTLELGDTMAQGALGVLIGTTNPRMQSERLSILSALSSSMNKIVDIITYTFAGIAGWIGNGKNPGLTGPIGIAQVTGEVAKVGVRPILELTALISISLAIVNILPIPALDGGRLLFVLIEAARGGKRISSNKEGLIHMVGFATLIGLVILMSYFDLVRILTGGQILQ